jgi:uncharacterized protein
MKSFQESQLAFAKHLRAPELYPAPEAIEDRRVGIYRELIYNNIESLIATVFPVLRSLLGNSDWHALIRDFIHQHHCQTPYFLEVSQEFLYYLMQERGARATDPVFLLELAHYEWVELALDVSEFEIPPANEWPDNLMLTYPRVSPLAMCLNYNYPVHKISTNYRVNEPEPTQLIVYRNRADKVSFMASNPLTNRLLYLLVANPDNCFQENMNILAAELQHPAPNVLFGEAEKLLKQLFDLHILSHFE